MTGRDVLLCFSHIAESLSPSRNTASRMSSSHLNIIPVELSMDVADALHPSVHFYKYVTDLWHVLNCFNVVIVQPHPKKHDR